MLRARSEQLAETATPSGPGPGSWSALTADNRGQRPNRPSHAGFGAPGMRGNFLQVARSVLRARSEHASPPAGPGGRRVAARGRRLAIPSTTISVPMPPETTEITGPKNCATVPDSKAPSSFDVPMNSPFSADTRPRIASGVSTCTSVPRSTTLMLSQAPSRTSRPERQPQVRRQAEGDRHDAVAGDRGQQRASRALPRRPVRLHEGRRDRAERRRGQQPAQLARADVQDVLGVDRHQRGRPAEQHREGVEQHRGQQDARPAQEVEAGGERRPRQLAALRRIVLVAQPRHEQHERQRGGGVEQVDRESLVEERDEEPTQRRAADAGQLEEARVPRHGVAEEWPPARAAAGSRSAPASRSCGRRRSRRAACRTPTAAPASPSRAPG